MKLVRSGLFIVLTCLTAVLYAENVAFKACPKGKGGSNDNMVKAIRVSKCSRPPCQLKRGETYTFEIDFVPERAASKVDVSAFGAFTDALELPWPGMKTNVCTNDIFNIKCPLEAKKTQTYTNKVHVLNSYPTAKISVHWKIKLDDKLISCSVIDVSIIN